MKKQSVKRLRTRWKIGPDTDSEQSLQKSNAACPIGYQAVSGSELYSLAMSVGDGCVPCTSKACRC